MHLHNTVNKMFFFHALPTKTKACSPLNMGLTFHTPKHPREVNWPNESSRKNKGMPQNTSIMKYGNINAPEKHTQSYIRSLYP